MSIFSLPAVLPPFDVVRPAESWGLVRKLGSDGVIEAFDSGVPFKTASRLCRYEGTAISLFYIIAQGL
jgi:hypothetical protein